MKPRRIVAIDAYNWTDLLRESQAEGYNMVKRLVTDFRAGVNRFDAAGEVLYAHFSGHVVIAVAGLNQDPDAAFPRAGRIRRLFVLSEFRRRGLARTLMGELTRYALPHFDMLTVNVGRLEARSFYERIGFQPIAHRNITHVKSFVRNQSS